MMIISIFRIAVILSGAIIMAIGALMFFLGPDATGNNFQFLPAWLLGSQSPAAGLNHVNPDSELRFFAVFFIAYGLILTRLSIIFPKHHRYMLPAFALFFIGGLGRLLSIQSLGNPHGLFQILMWVELSGPLVLAALYFAAIRKQP